MMQHIANFSRRTCQRMAGGCPYYGSGAATTSTSNGRRSMVTATQKAHRQKVRLDKEEEQFRDVSIWFLT